MRQRDGHFECQRQNSNGALHGIRSLLEAVKPEFCEPDEIDLMRRLSNELQEKLYEAQTIQRIESPTDAD